VLGPHFEQLARTWTERCATVRTLGGRPSRVGFTQVNDAAARSVVEIDVVAVSGNPAADRPRVLAVGEAKGGVAHPTVADLHDLERKRTILGERADVTGAKLLLISRSGFEPDVQEMAETRDDVGLVDLERLYRGD